MPRWRPGPWLWCPLVLGVDFLSKRYVLAHRAEFVARIELLGDLARFSYVRNPGAAMGLLPGIRWLLVAVSVVLSVVLVRYYRRTDSPARRGALAAILGGALGNLIDRLFYGGLVVDFIDLGIGTHRFYTFNVADMGVSLGGFVLLLSLWREGRRAERAQAGSPAMTVARPGETGSCDGPAAPEGQVLGGARERRDD